MWIVIAVDYHREAVDSKGTARLSHRIIEGVKLFAVAHFSSEFLFWKREEVMDLGYSTEASIEGKR